MSFPLLSMLGKKDLAGWVLTDPISALGFAPDVSCGSFECNTSFKLSMYRCIKN